jgi:hypothetical protein
MPGPPKVNSFQTEIGREESFMTGRDSEHGAIIADANDYLGSGQTLAADSSQQRSFGEWQGKTIISANIMGCPPPKISKPQADACRPAALKIQIFTRGMEQPVRKPPPSILGALSSVGCGFCRFCAEITLRIEGIPDCKSPQAMGAGHPRLEKGQADSPPLVTVFQPLDALTGGTYFVNVAGVYKHR